MLMMQEIKINRHFCHSQHIIILFYWCNMKTKWLGHISSRLNNFNVTKNKKKYAHLIWKYEHSISLPVVFRAPSFFSPCPRFCWPTHSPNDTGGIQAPNMAAWTADLWPLCTGRWHQREWGPERCRNPGYRRWCDRWWLELVELQRLQGFHYQVR